MESNGALRPAESSETQALKAVAPCGGTTKPDGRPVSWHSVQLVQSPDQAIDLTIRKLFRR